MRILILGAGAVGRYFGARLVEAGADVSFLVRPGRAESLRREGLRVESPCGAFHCFPRILEAASAAAPTRLVILACKAYDLPSAMAAVAPALGQDTLIVPLLNGIRHLTTLDDAFGRQRVAGGIAHLAVTSTEDGNIRHLSPAHRLIVGARDDAQASRLDEFAALATTANFAFAASADIVREMWEKLVFLATLAGATYRYRRPMGQITATESGLVHWSVISLPNAKPLPRHVESRWISACWPTTGNNLHYRTLNRPPPCRGTWRGAPASNGRPYSTI